VYLWRISIQRKAKESGGSLALLGDPLADQPCEVPQHSGEPETDDVSTAALLKLARKQGMNTDIRRSVFVVLMSSDVGIDVYRCYQISFRVCRII
jgi:hypothetical protein